VNLRLPLVLLPVLLLPVAGCATRHQRYDWGSYDPSLYSYYKDPTKVAELSASLAAVIDAAAANHAVVPPGIYAEYGYLQLQQGKTASAVELFKKEESQWPESKVFIDRMIKVASAPVASAPTAGGAP
jgi:hypothetical protein